MRHNPLVRLMHPWWRLTRGLTLGVRGIVADAAGRVMLVRHSYQSGWHLPGGGVNRGETVQRALARELHEEAGVVLNAPARLHGVFSNEAVFPGDHVAVFVAGAWEREAVRPRGVEILDAQLFPREALPETTTPGTRRRLAELFDGAALSETW